VGKDGGEEKRGKWGGKTGGKYKRNSSFELFTKIVPQGRRKKCTVLLSLNPWEGGGERLSVANDLKKQKKKRRY